MVRGIRMNRGHLGLAVLVVFLAQHTGERGTGLAEVVNDVYRAEVMVGGRWSVVVCLDPGPSGPHTGRPVVIGTGTGTDAAGAAGTVVAALPDSESIRPVPYLWLPCLLMVLRIIKFSKRGLAFVKWSNCYYNSPLLSSRPGTLSGTIPLSDGCCAWCACHLTSSPQQQEAPSRPHLPPWTESCRCPLPHSPIPTPSR